MKNKSIVWTLVAVLVVAGGAYLMSSSASTGNLRPAPALGLNGSSGQTNTGKKTVLPSITLAHAMKLGVYLVAENGMTLYHYAKDTEGVSNCAETCAVNWPPYAQIAAEPLLVGDGMTGTISTITRMDGTQQIMYKGAPLYFWKGDKEPGDTTGNGVGGLWTVARP